jgi:hypothetical protein
MIKRAVKSFSHRTSLSSAISHLLVLFIALTNQILLVIMQDKQPICQELSLLNFLFFLKSYVEIMTIDLKMSTL